MIKGIDRHVVVLKNTGSEIFEEAIFILKTTEKPDNKELIKECEKIIKDNSNEKNAEKNNKSIKYFLWSIMTLLLIFSILLAINLL